MIITFQTPEERWATSLWEVAIFSGDIIVKSVLFIPSGPIFPEGGISRLILHDGLEDLAMFTIEKDLRRFQICNFTVTAHQAENRTLYLRKELSMGKNVAIPHCLIQVESWQ